MKTLCFRIHGLVGPKRNSLRDSRGTDGAIPGSTGLPIHGNMCCGVLKEELVLRLEPDRAQELLNRPHTRPMDFTGRPMKGFVFIGADGLETEWQLRDWISTSLAFARSLPAKTRGKSALRRVTTRRKVRG